MKERPILFSGPMVRAILDGRKSQTRRVVKPQPETMDGDSGIQFDYPHWHTTLGAKRFANEYCKFGRVGDRLWVRETWLPYDEDQIGDCKYAYRADTNEDNEDIRKEYIRRGRKYQWRPSIHMPRLASRITLEITGVRVERLHDISEADAMAEGMHKFASLELWGSDPNGTPGPMVGGSAVEAFGLLWESINGAGSWFENPWVWVLSFQRI